MVYGIVNVRTNKRVRFPSGKLTPVFDYPVQAQKYIDNVLGGSKSSTYKKLGGK